MGGLHLETRSARTFVISATLVLLAIVPSGATGETPPTRFVVGFHEMPMTLAVGDDYDGSTIIRTIPQLGAIVVQTVDGAFAQRQRADADVRYVENDDPIPLLLLTPNDPQFASMYGPQQVDAPTAWDTTLGDGDAAVCVLDTGVRKTHEDLGTARYLGGHDFINNDGDPADDHGHGTHVSGTAVGAVNNALGVAGMGNTHYYGVKVLNAGGSGSWSAVAEGVTWCADNTIARTVLSMSLGGSGGATVLADAVHYAFATKGKPVVAASGNGYCDNCVLYPGAYPEVITVGCTNSAEASCAFTSKGPQMDVAAPGEGILSTCYSSDSAYCSSSGTSMSTPHVAGALALAWSHHTGMSAGCLWQRLNNTADDFGAVGKDNAFGWGRLDAATLIAGTDCVAPPPGPPAAPTVTALAGPGVGQITLSWPAPYDNGSPITGYSVYRSTSATGGFTLRTTTTARTFSDTGLGNGNTFYYKVLATNAVGDSPFSAVVSATTFSLPSAPRDLDANPGTSLLTIDLTWATPASNGGASITQYRIYRDGAFLATSSVTSYRDRGLDPTAVYHYEVSAVNIVGEGAHSNDACSRPNPWPRTLQATCEIV